MLLIEHQEDEIDLVLSALEDAGLERSKEGEVARQPLASARQGKRFSPAICSK
jgi:hypothetical protein